MSENFNERLNEMFIDYISYLIFMSKQISGHQGPYCHFALIKALEKVLELQKESGEIRDLEFFDQLRTELESVRGTSSGDMEVWNPFIDKLTSMTTKAMKDLPW
jgi:hypothetical protein